MRTQLAEPLAGLLLPKGMTTGEISTERLRLGTTATTRTSEEVSEYMKGQPWLYKFLRNCRFKGKIKKAQVQAILSGKYGEHTMRSGFTWTLSFEGFGYWKKKNDEFIKWYYGNEIKN